MTNRTSWNESTAEIVIEAGRDVAVAPIIYRETAHTEPFGPDAIHVLPFTTVMLDKRAPGLFTSTLSGANAKLEWLAEMMVRSGSVAEVARALMKHDIVAQVNDRLLKGSARFKQGAVLMSYPALYRTMIDITGAPNDRMDAKRVTARVLTELFMRIYSAFNVMMPSRPIYAQESYSRPVAMTSDLISASHVATVTEVLETLKLGVSMKEKEFSAQVVETVLGPVLIGAANRLLAAEKYNRWMVDAASIVGLYLRNVDDPALENLRDDGNLQILATNASFAVDAMVMERFGRGVISPPHEHREILAYAALRLRELRRYESVSLEKFANMYSFSQIKTAKGHTAGVYVHRNADVTCNAKAITLHEDGGVIIPLNAHTLDPYIPMMNEFVNAAFGGSTPVAAGHAFASHIIARSLERDPTKGTGRVLAFNITEDELRMLACAHADELIISSNVTRVGPGGSPTMFFGVRDGKVVYTSSAYYNGTQVYTSDPSEVLILTGEDYTGNQRFVTKPQTYAEDIFGGLLDQVDTTSLYNSATRVVNVELPLPDGTNVDLGISLHGLLTGSEPTNDLASYIAIDRQAADVITAFLALGVVAYNDLAAQDDPTDRVMAEQVATGLHHVISRFTSPIGFSRFMRTLNIQLMGSDSFGTRDKRALLTNTVSQHSLAIRLVMAMLLRMGLVPYGIPNDVIEILTNAKSIERAATSDAFKNILTGRI